MDKGERAWGLIFLLMLGSFLFPLAVLAWFGITWIIPSSTPSFDLQTSSITLASAPGKAVTFELHSKSIGGYWASKNGLALALQNGNSFQIVQPVNQSWSDSMTVCAEGNCPSAPPINADFTIPVNFTLPSSYTVGTRLNGTLTGDVISPQPSGPDGFTNDETDLNVPVTIEVIAHPLPHHHSKALFGFSLRIALSWLVIDVFVLIALVRAAVA
jgi:hypothetical protein